MSAASEAMTRSSIERLIARGAPPEEVGAVDAAGRLEAHLAAVVEQHQVAAFGVDDLDYGVDDLVEKAREVVLGVDVEVDVEQFEQVVVFVPGLLDVFGRDGAGVAQEDCADLLEVGGLLGAAVQQARQAQFLVEIVFLLCQNASLAGLVAKY